MSAVRGGIPIVGPQRSTSVVVPDPESGYQWRRRRMSAAGALLALGVLCGCASTASTPTQQAALAGASDPTARALSAGRCPARPPDTVVPGAGVGSGKPFEPLAADEVLICRYPGYTGVSTLGPPQLTRIEGRAQAAVWQARFNALDLVKPGSVYNCPAYTRGEVVLGFIGQAKTVVIKVDVGMCDFATNGKRLAQTTTGLEADLLSQKP